MDYLPRVVDTELDLLLGALPAVSIEGPRSVGKTATAARRAAHSFDLQEAGQRALVAADPRLVTSREGLTLIDEWQVVPDVWNVVRRVVDEGAPAGRFLLTGSAGVLPGPAVHSGAGRIVGLRMRPMTLIERGVTTPTVSLAGLVRGTGDPLAGESTMRLPDYVAEIAASGFPGIRATPKQVRDRVLDDYSSRLIDRDIEEAGYDVRRPHTLRAWLRAYAAASGTSTDYARILEAATAGQADKPAQSTVIGYREILTRLWLLEPVPGWDPGQSAISRLRRGPKHYLADPALAASLLGATEESLLDGSAKRLGTDAPLAGGLFESLVALTLRVFAQGMRARISHFRLARGTREVDFIVERPDGRFVAVESKLSSSVDSKDVRHLVWLREQVGPRLVDTIVVTTGDEAYRRRDGVGVVPLALLGP